MSKEKKTLQLGMNPSTASGRLVKDLLFKFATEAGHKCFRCGEELERKSFSIEHKEDWLDSEDPVKLYFDLGNIAFSHLSCNVGASRATTKGQKTPHGTPNRYTTHGCRCTLCVKGYSDYRAAKYTKENRQERYKRTGT